MHALVMILQLIINYSVRLLFCCFLDVLQKISFYCLQGHITQGHITL